MKASSTDADVQRDAPSTPAPESRSERASTWKRDAIEWAQETIENGPCASISSRMAEAVAQTVMASVEHGDKLAAILAECAPWLKDGETPAQRIKRERDDTQCLLGELAKERLKCEALEREIGFVRIAYDQLVARRDQEIERAKAIPAQKAESALSEIQPTREDVIDECRDAAHDAIHHAVERMDLCAFVKGHVDEALLALKKAAPQELPAVNSASRQDDSSSTYPGTGGRSVIGQEKDESAPVRDSAKYPAEPAAPCVVVPMEPTHGMLKALAGDPLLLAGSDEQELRLRYAAMLAATPKGD